jgi:hypothetical protein
VTRRSDSLDGLPRRRDVRVPVSPMEGALLDAWAEREGVPLAELVRDAALEAAARSSIGNEG